MENAIYHTPNLEVPSGIENVRRYSKSIFSITHLKNLLCVVKKLVRAICLVIFTPPPQQEKIEEVRMKAMQYRGLF